MTTSRQMEETLEFMRRAAGGPLTVSMLLESHRKAEGWSQAELGRRLSVSRAYVNAVEKGRKVVSPAQAARFAHVFEMDEQQWVIIALEDQLRNDGLHYRVLLKTGKRRPSGASGHRDCR